MSAPYDTAIVGAGAAGIAAASRLAEQGRSVILIEATSRVGGRAWTQDVDGMTLDLGCGWLHSAERNPLTAIAERSGFPVDRRPSAWRAQYRDLGFSPAEQQAAEAAWDAFEQRLIDAPPASDRAAEALEPGCPWNARAEALSGYMNGAGLDRLSVTDYLAYDRAASDNNWRVREGYGTLISAQLPAVTLSLANPVTAIEQGSRAIRLTTRAGVIEAATAVVTVSTAVLASGAIRFDPLVDDHLHAAACLPLGLADKLFLALDGEHGLDAESHLIGNPRSAETGSYYIRPFGRPVIEAFFGGQGAVVLEEAGIAGAFGLAIDELAALLGSDIRQRLRPLATSSWGRMDHVRGSYSHALPGRAGARAILARPAGERLVFAGEATHPHDFSTAHGAWQSGIRAADEVSAVLGGGST